MESKTNTWTPTILTEQLLMFVKQSILSGKLYHISNRL